MKKKTWSFLAGRRSVAVAALCFPISKFAEKPHRQSALVSRDRGDLSAEIAPPHRRAQPTAQVSVNLWQR
jgi:hypothetical protein